ncbi:MAG TPA: hypothetical protein VMW93_07970 [bacterium]|nr:hypothetical protein [bacterium]
MAPLVKSVYDDQEDLLANMVGLHSGGVVECDATYGRGRFYRYTLEPPRLKFDIAPRVPGVVAADVRRLPLRTGAVASAMFDPPFLDGGRKTTGVMPRKYTSWDTWMPDLLRFYGEAMVELRRVLAHKGILYFKCQDLMSGRRNFFNHVSIYNNALELGFRAKDLFILLAKTRPLQHNLFRQVTARKYHCYFWVFENWKKNA